MYLGLLPLYERYATGLTENELSTSPINNDRDKMDKFIEKVLLYIWEDVAKIDPSLWFDDEINTFDNLVNKPTNMKFTYDGKTSDSLKGLEDVLKGRIALNDARTKTLTIKWAWDYQTGTTAKEKENNDKIDTNDSGKDFSFDIKVTGTQVNPQG